MPTTTGKATEFITFSRASNATVIDSDGKVKWAPHNLVLNSASPATQSITVLVGAQYTVAITGAGSVALSAAATGTATAASPATVTATTTTLTLTVTAPVTTMWAYRSDLGGMQANAQGSLYNPTTGSIYYGPRRDFDPVTLACKGLLVEEQRTNFVLNSGLSGGVSGTPGTAPTSWSYLNTGTPSFTYATDNEAGGNTVRVVTDTTQRGILRQSVSLSANTVYFASMVVDVASSAALFQYITWSAPPAGATITFSLNGGVVAGSTNVPLGRNTIAAIVTVAATAGSAELRIGCGAQSAGIAFDITIRQVQVEAGAFRTSYIPTGAATATRSADVASVATSAFPYSSTEGSLVAAFTPVNVAAARRAAQIDDGTTNERVTLGTNSTPNGLFTVIDGGVSQAAIATGTPAANTTMKLAARWKANDFAASANGGAASTDTNGAIATGATTLRLGSGTSSTEPLNGWLRQVTYLPRALSDAELQQRSA